MSLAIPDEVLQSIRVSEVETWRQIAMVLCQTEKLSLAEAARLAQMPRFRSTITSSHCRPRPGR